MIYERSALFRMTTDNAAAECLRRVPAASVYFEGPDGHLLEYLAKLPEDPKPELGVVS